MNPQKGFTLVETLSAGIVSTILAGALLTIFSMTNIQIKESAANLTLGQIQSIVSEQIRRDARLAFGIKIDTLTPFQTDRLNEPAFTNQSKVFFCDQDGRPFSGYQINYGYLEELKDNVGFVKFQFGNQTVPVDAVRFDVLSRREGISFQIAYRLQLDKVYTLPVLQETVRSRNN